MKLGAHGNASSGQFALWEALLVVANVVLSPAVSLISIAGSRRMICFQRLCAPDPVMTKGQLDTENESF